MKWIDALFQSAPNIVLLLPMHKSKAFLIQKNPQRGRKEKH